MAVVTKLARYRHRRRYRCHHHPRPAGHCCPTPRHRHVSLWRFRRARTPSTSSTADVQRDATHAEETWTSKMLRPFPERLTMRMVQMKAIAFAATCQHLPAVRTESYGGDNSNNQKALKEYKPPSAMTNKLSRNVLELVDPEKVWTWGRPRGKNPFMRN